MPIAKDKKQINILLTIEDAERLKSLADKQERSVSQMAAIFIRESLDRVGAKKRANTEQMSAEEMSAEELITQLEQKQNQEAARDAKEKDSIPGKPEEKKAKTMSPEEFRQYAEQQRQQDR